MKLSEFPQKVSWVTVSDTIYLGIYDAENGCITDACKTEDLSEWLKQHNIGETFTMRFSDSSLSERPLTKKEQTLFKILLMQMDDIKGTAINYLENDLFDKAVGNEG